MAAARIAQAIQPSTGMEQTTAPRRREDEERVQELQQLVDPAALELAVQVGLVMIEDHRTVDLVEGPQEVPAGIVGGGLLLDQVALNAVVGDCAVQRLEDTSRRSTPCRRTRPAAEGHCRVVRRELLDVVGRQDEVDAEVGVELVEAGLLVGGSGLPSMPMAHASPPRQISRS